MSRPIAYNASGPLSGSIRGGNVNYTVDSGNRDYTSFASKKWVPSADGAAPIVFVTDTYTQGFQGNPSLAVPLFYSCNGTSSAAIIYTANRLPGSPGNYSDANTAISDLITARGYFILESNDPFEGVDTDSLVLDVDASKISSYPQTGTSWRDLSGNSNNGALTNGPTWNSNGWFDFDGTDDWVQISTLALSTTTYTKIAWFNPDGATNNIISGGSGDGQHAFWMGGTATNLQAGHNGAWSTVNYSPGTMTGRWWFGAVTFNTTTGWKLYMNGQVVSTSANTSTFSGGAAVRIAAYNNADNLFNGKIATAQVYNKVLSDTEIKQNYFGSPIVTDGLVFAVDANNIVSYPKSGTTAFGLTGSLSGSLINGTGFELGNGGSWYFDGTDDYIRVNTGDKIRFQDSSVFTVSLWFNWESIAGATGNRQYLWENRTLNSDSYYVIIIDNENASVPALKAIMRGSVGEIGANSNLPSFNTWINYTAVFNITGGIVTSYVNGIQTATTSAAPFSGGVSGATAFLGIFRGGGYSFNGNIANFKIYNKALSAAEIQQNYQAEQYRFFDIPPDTFEAVQLANAYEARVVTNGGTVEGYDCMVNKLADLGV